VSSNASFLPVITVSKHIMRRSQSSDNSASLNTREPVRLIKSRSEAVINPTGAKAKPQPLSTLNSYDEDEEDEIQDHEEEDDEQYEVCSTISLNVETLYVNHKGR
jgi:hypothetical protein